MRIFFSVVVCFVRLMVEWGEFEGKQRQQQLGNNDQTALWNSMPVAGNFKFNAYKI
jgi:hypothetical protein